MWRLGDLFDAECASRLRHDSKRNTRERPGDARVRECELSHLSQGMAPIVARVERACGNDVPLVHVDVGSAAGQRVAARYGIVGVPTFIAVDRTGDEVERRLGAQTEHDLTGLMQDLAGHSCARANGPRRGDSQNTSGIATRDCSKTSTEDCHA